MAASSGPGPTGPPPMVADEAFELLGNSTRVSILQELGVADGPLSFSDLRERVDVADSGRFNYHLGKLQGRFVHRTGDGYVLRETGRRVIEAVFSGVLTEIPEPERVDVDLPCPHCAAPVEVRVHPGGIEKYCTECPGSYRISTTSGVPTEAATGYLGKLTLPPAGFQDRSPEEVFRAAQVWGNAEVLVIANGICPRCSARLEITPTVCANHSPEGDPCEACGNHYGAMMGAACTNCIFTARGTLSLLLYAHPAVQAFKVGHGANLVAPEGGANPLSNCEEEILSADPLEVRYTYEYDGETLALAVDDELEVTAIPNE